MVEETKNDLFPFWLTHKLKNFVDLNIIYAIAEIFRAYRKKFEGTLFSLNPDWLDGINVMRKATEHGPNVEFEKKSCQVRR